MRYGRRTGRQSFQARVKKVLMKNTETKFYQIGLEDKNLYHDVGNGTGPTTDQKALLFNPWTNIDKGTAAHERIGDKIVPRMMVCRLWLANKADRPNILYRVIVARLPKIYGGSATSGTNLDLFRADNLSSNGNTLCGMIDNEKGIRAYYDRVFSNEIGFTTTAGSGVSNRECHKFLRIKIKRKGARPIVYESGGGIVNNPVAIYVIPYDSYGTLQTDNIASCALTTRLYYKDI